LAEERFILFPRSHGAGFHDQIVSLCHQSGFSPKVVQEATQMQTILSLVAAGIGVALIPASVQSLRNEGVHYKPIRERTPVTGIALAWLRDSNSPVMDHFIEVAKAVARVARQ
ncbi:MAG: LysR family substrate-binding domain-containing protein, partial [Acidobacteria bacterium]|nr:LysR family substrate-binding domain-containing protein [Acidobacteriota bacterium]